jgi:hypothetical protein
LEQYRGSLVERLEQRFLSREVGTVQRFLSREVGTDIRGWDGHSLVERLEQKFLGREVGTEVP